MRKALSDMGKGLLEALIVGIVRIVGGFLIMAVVLGVFFGGLLGVIRGFEHYPQAMLIGFLVLAAFVIGKSVVE